MSSSTLLLAQKSTTIFKSAHEIDLEDLETHFKRLEQARRKHVLDPMPEQARSIQEKHQIAAAVMRETRIEREILARQRLEASSNALAAPASISVSRQPIKSQSARSSELAASSVALPIASVLEEANVGGFSDPLLLASLSRTYEREWVHSISDPQQRYLIESSRRPHHGPAPDLNAMIAAAEDELSGRKLATAKSKHVRATSSQVVEAEMVLGAAKDNTLQEQELAQSNPEVLMNSILAVRATSSPPKVAAANKVAVKEEQEKKAPRAKKTHDRVHTIGTNMLVQEDSLTGVGQPRLANIEPHGGCAPNLMKLVKSINEDSVRLDYSHDGLSGMIYLKVTLMYT